MKQTVLIIASLYGMFSVIFGAFGAHALKKIISVEKLSSFEVGVRYQMYHAIILLVIGLLMNFNTGIEKSAAWFLIMGTFLFSFSIYGLALTDHINIPSKILGPITPLGGLCLIIGWALLLWYFIKSNF